MATDMSQPGAALASIVPLKFDRASLVRGVSLRVAIALIAIGTALVAFNAGVGVSDQPDLPALSVPTQIYFALGLFVFGGLDLGVPASGPIWAQSLLWVAYFACPAIATAAIAEGVGRVLRSELDPVADLDDHVIVVGDSTLAELYLGTFSDEELERRDILLVHPGEYEPVTSDYEYRDGIHQLRGDLTNRRFAERINVADAAKILLLTDQDVANLEVGLFLVEESGVRADRVVIHISDIALKRDVDKTQGIPNALEIFNGHEIAADHLLDETIGFVFDETDYSDQVILGGFGRFGQSMLASLHRRMSEEFKSVGIIDHRATSEFRVFELQNETQFDEQYDLKLIDGDIRDPQVWDQATEQLTEETDNPVIILGVDDDATNLQVALWLQRRFENATLIVRTVDSVHLSNRMAAERTFQIENVRRRTREYMQGRWLDR